MAPKRIPSNWLECDLCWYKGVDLIAELYYSGWFEHDLDIDETPFPVPPTPPPTPEPFELDENQKKNEELKKKLNKNWEAWLNTAIGEWHHVHHYTPQTLEAQLDYRFVELAKALIDPVRDPARPSPLPPPTPTPSPELLASDRRCGSDVEGQAGEQINHTECVNMVQFGDDFREKWGVKSHGGAK